MDLNIISIIVLVLLAIFIYLKRRYIYWEKKGLAYLEPEFYYGNTRELFTRKTSFGQQFLNIYRQIKSRGLKHAGIYIFFTPVYVPTDPEKIKCIFQNDFNHFTNHGGYFNEEADPLTGHLFNLEGTKWRNLRTKLTPTFTSGKMKMMYQTLVECSYGLKDLLDEQMASQDGIDIKDVVARFTTDIIGSCAFGINCNSLKDPDSEFRSFGKKLFESTSFSQKVKRLIVALVPKPILKKIGFKLFRKDIEAFFMNMVRNTIDYREKNKVYRKDFMQLLIQLKNQGKISDNDNITEQEVNNEKGQFLSFNEIAAQCFVFFVAGFETSSTTMTFALYELATNPDVQDKLREEIETVINKNDNKVTYDSIMEMSYLEKVINETLRKYPPLPGIPRVCNKEYTVPGTNIVLEEGTQVHIPVYGIQNDPEYYPNPEIFDPERFSEENKAKRPAFTFFPFGEGPRICIGLRFGKLQAKLGLITILRNYKVTLNEKTKTPLKIDPTSFLLSAEGGVWLNLSKL